MNVFRKYLYGFLDEYCWIVFTMFVFQEVSGDVQATQEKARQRELEEERQQPLALQVTLFLSTFFRTDPSLTMDACRVYDALCFVFSSMMMMMMMMMMVIFFLIALLILLMKLISSKDQVCSKRHCSNRNGLWSMH